MSAESPLTEITTCPRCGKSPLTEAAGALQCKACKVEYPSIGGIPWLFAEPDASLGEWRNRLHFALQQLSNEAAGIKAELQNDGLIDLTRQRLEQQLDAIDQHRNALRKILAPIDIQSSQASYESYLALRTRLPSDHGIATYYANIHRDWSWGDTENAASLEQIKNCAGDVELGKTLVLGAGAGRLSYDIHMQMETELCVAIDFNPLLMLVAKSMAQGDQLELYEFPLAPKRAEDFAVLRKLAAPAAVRDQFHLVLGDVLRPPFAAASFDTIVTPWIIDIVGDDLPFQAARINNLLKPEGRWLNFGSLAFNHADKARCYSAEETLVHVEKAGFAPATVNEVTIPYMCSPASRHGRQETVFSFSATKQSDVKAPPRHKALPDWIVTGKDPVPALQAFRTQAVSTQVYAFIMSLIDGKRTIADMAKILEQQKLMTTDEAIPAIRNFMTRMYDDAQKGKSL
ncbi:MAG: methyltransferase domain-containing protein [Woeseia sp.]|jgi:hypothetical protein|nr:methyltransferase domain-containing protein [Woeseia sp.]